MSCIGCKICPQNFGHAEVVYAKIGEMVTLTRRIDRNWFDGRIGNRKGIFPVSYVDVICEPGITRSELRLESLVKLNRRSNVLKYFFPE